MTVPLPMAPEVSTPVRSTRGHGDGVPTTWKTAGVAR